METYDKLMGSGFEAEDHGCRAQFVCSEKRSKYVLSLEPAMEGWRYLVDDYLIKEGDKCDALILVRDGADFAEVFVELKGSDVRHAITQLEETLRHNLFKSSNSLMRWGRIAIYSYPKSMLLDREVDQKTKEFQKQYHCELQITRADTLTHDMFEAIRKEKTLEPRAINISEYLNSGNDSNVSEAIAILFLHLKASHNPAEVVNTDNVLQLLSLLIVSDGSFVPNALGYVKLCLEKCNDVFWDDNIVMYMNELLEKYKAKYNGSGFVLAEEIEDRGEDVRQSLLAIYDFLKEMNLSADDEDFWSAI